MNLSRGQTTSLESRVFRGMIATVGIGVIGGLIAAPWRVTTGLIVGGSLSLLNYHWLLTSMAAVFAASTSDAPPRISVIRYILRYLVTALVITIAYMLRMISLPATIIGLCSFVPAFFIEASRRSYLAIIGREESV